MRQLRAHRWPGNVRELKSVVELALIASQQGRLESIPPPTAWRATSVLPGRGLVQMAEGDRAGVLSGARDEFERELLHSMLIRCGWNKSRTARELGIHRNTLEYRIRRLKLERPGKKT